VEQRGGRAVFAARYLAAIHALMPIVAGMGGNAGNQALAVSVGHGRMPKGRHPLEVATEILEQADRSEPTVHAPVEIGERVQVVQQGTIDVASILDEQAIVGAGALAALALFLASIGVAPGALAAGPAAASAARSPRRSSGCRSTPGPPPRPAGCPAATSRS
jgi:hypothetical protein